MDPLLKDVFQIIAWLVASVGGVFAAYRGIVEVRRNREHRQGELLWRKARQAKELLDEMEDDRHARDAMTMLDWSGREYEISDSRRETVTYQEVYYALRTTNTVFEDGKEVYIRDCFDHFFDCLEELEHFISIDLIRFEDVEGGLLYYIDKMMDNKSAFDGFMREYRYNKALAFVDRFDRWRKA